jgi:cephalosporin hydroxylase
MTEYSFPTPDEIHEISKHVRREPNKDTEKLEKDGRQWTRTAWENKLDYEVNWFGVPIIQNPYDMVVMQELIYELQPDVIVETGVAHGGSLIYYASLLELLKKGKVIGIDIDIREHNRKLIDKHPFINRVEMIEASSTAESTIKQVKSMIKPTDKVLVILDSDHTKPHVAAEMDAYKDIVTTGSYMVVFDTFMPYLVGLKGETDHFKDDSAMDALKEFITKHSNFEIDSSRNRFYVSSCPDGFLKKVRD